MSDADGDRAEDDNDGGGISEADELRYKLRETEQLLIARSSELEALQNEAVHTTLKTMILKARNNVAEAAPAADTADTAG